MAVAARSWKASAMASCAMRRGLHHFGLLHADLWPQQGLRAEAYVWFLISDGHH